MDLATRALMVGGLLLGIIIIAGLALAIGRFLQKRRLHGEGFDSTKEPPKNKKEKKPRRNRGRKDEEKQENISPQLADTSWGEEEPRGSNEPKRAAVDMDTLPSTDSWEDDMLDAPAPTPAPVAAPKPTPAASTPAAPSLPPPTTAPRIVTPAAPKLPPPTAAPAMKPPAPPVQPLPSAPKLPEPTGSSPFGSAVSAPEDEDEW